MTARLFVSAGEPSGDRHLSRVLAHLQARCDMEVRGLGGPLSREQGASLLTEFDRLSVLGFSEVLKSIPFFLRLERTCIKVFETWRPDAVLLVDYPGFNQRLGRAAKARGIPVVYYIAPQVWAWKRERRPGLARSLDHLLTVFPFEKELFEEAGIRTTFVGHPLLDSLPPEGVNPFKNGMHSLALLPGSRHQEVEALLPIMVEAVLKLKEIGVQAVVSKHPNVNTALYDCAQRAGLECWEGPIWSLVSAANAAIVASGTATLEAGLTGTPMVVVYRTGRINWQLAKRLIRIRTVALANIAAGGDRIPELLQGDCTFEKLASMTKKLLLDPQERQEQSAYLAKLKDRLGTPGAAERVCDIVLKALEQA